MNLDPRRAQGHEFSAVVTRERREIRWHALRSFHSSGGRDGELALDAITLCFALVVAGCDALGDPTDGNLLGAPASHGDTPTMPVPASASSQAPTPVAPPSGPAPLYYDDAQAIGWLQSRCGNCHSPTAAGRTDGSWPMPKTISLEWLESTEFTTVAYELMRKKAYETSAAGYPAPMPKGGMDADAMNALIAVLDWFKRRLPFTVADADVLYHRKPNALPRPAVTFQCNLPASLSTFLRRLTSAALNRAPTPTELAAWSASDLGAPVTTAQRALLVKRLSAEWKTEFLTSGLAKLTTAIGNAGAQASPTTAPLEGGAEVAFPSAANELYRLAFAHYDGWSYTRYFTENVVMADTTTAPIYGCSLTQGTKECPLIPPRFGFFSTLGYLQLLPQSFVRLENNTRRFSGMYMTLIGDAHARAGALDPITAPPPDCIDATDKRYELPNLKCGNGTYAILQDGVACQSCHLRGPAAGQVLFRPFSSSGLLFDAATLGNPGTPDASDVAAAMGPSFGRADAPMGMSTPVDKAFLATVLTSRKACVSTNNPAAPYQNVQTVSDLAQYFINRDPDAIARGFVRHAHRAFSTPSAPTMVNAELFARSMLSFDAGDSTLAGLVSAYFMADSLACLEEH